MKRSLFVLIAVGVVLGSALVINARTRPQNPEHADFLTPEIQKPVWAAEYPELPVYPDAKLRESEIEPLEDSTKYMAAWQTDDDIPGVVIWYTRALEDSGWQVYVPTADPASNSMQHVVFRRDSFLLYVSVLIDPAVPGTSIIIEIGKIPGLDVS